MYSVSMSTLLSHRYNSIVNIPFICALFTNLKYIKIKKLQYIVSHGMFLLHTDLMKSRFFLDIYLYYTHYIIMFKINYLYTLIRIDSINLTKSNYSNPRETKLICFFSIWNVIIARARIWHLLLDAALHWNVRVASEGCKSLTVYIKLIVVTVLI